MLAGVPTNHTYPLYLPLCDRWTPDVDTGSTAGWVENPGCPTSRDTAMVALSPEELDSLQSGSAAVQCRFLEGWWRTRPHQRYAKTSKLVAGWRKGYLHAYYPRGLDYMPDKYKGRFVCSNHLPPEHPCNASVVGERYHLKGVHRFVDGTFGSIRGAADVWVGGWVWVGGCVGVCVCVCVFVCACARALVSKQIDHAQHSRA